MKYEVLASKDVPEEYRVEAIDPKSGECYVVIFSGPDAKDRALEYAAFKNAQVPVAV